MQARAVSLQDGLTLLKDVKLMGAAEEGLLRAASQRAERIVDEGDAATAIAADDQIALRVEQALGALLALLELPVAIGQLLAAFGQRAGAWCGR